MVATSVVALVLGATVATAATPSLPQAPLPAPPVELPAVPVPVPAPAPPVELPSAPVPAVPAPAPAPVAQAPAKLLGDSVRTAVGELAGESQQAVESAGSAGDGGSGERRARKRGRGSIAESSYRERRRVVNRLRGCLDELQPLRAQVLVLRYGVGPVNARPARRVATRLGLSLRRYEIVRRRAMQRLVALGRTGGCRGSGAPVATIVRAGAGGGGGAATELLTFASFGTGAGGDSGGGGSGGRTEVLGTRAEGEEEAAPFPESPATGALSLPDETSDMPFLLALGAFFLAFLLWVLARRRRTLRSNPYERP